MQSFKFESSLKQRLSSLSWVVVLDFFGIGSAPTQAPRPAPVNRRFNPARDATADAYKAGQQRPFNTEIDLKVKALSVMLNRQSPEEVASIQAREFSSRVSLRDGDFSVGGRLGVFSLRDLSPDGGMLYRDRLLSRGEDLLTFHLFKYGGEDEKLERYVVEYPTVRKKIIAVFKKQTL